MTIHVSSLSGAALEQLNDGRARNALEQNVDQKWIGHACADGYYVRSIEPFPLQLPRWIDPSTVTEIKLEVTFKVEGEYPNHFGPHAYKQIRRRNAIVTIVDSGGMQFVKLRIIAKNLPALVRAWREIMQANEEGEQSVTKLGWQF